MTIGIGVEGISDKIFFDKILHKRFPNCRLQIRNLKDKSRLIRDSAKLLENFRGAHYHAGIILLDSDRDPCVEFIRDLFSDSCKDEFSKARPNRFLHLVVAKKGLECWLMADEEAIRQSSGNHEYLAEPETALINPKTTIEKVFANKLSKVELAPKIASSFDLGRASTKSESLRYFQEILDKVTTTV